ncbi:hypothetical protein B0H66DRAFT_570165 [Apodospora peruviana]|uniref:Peptidase C14 caspase domain-containing protein n=1 Tax=Apodospora peruviana TaxID=516989 RepID=A0AAE0HT72_9PEZI|nr:hypothetical protein B0H66DRAFT_570165 [Apodospora peruviana]
MASTSQRHDQMAQYPNAALLSVKWNHCHRLVDPDNNDNTERLNDFEAAVTEDVNSLKGCLRTHFNIRNTHDFVVKRERNMVRKKKPYRADPVIGAITTAAGTLEEDDLFIFFYSGFGERAPGAGAELNFANGKRGRYFGCDPIFAALKALPCDVLVILDCCNAVNLATNPIRSAGEMQNKKMIIIGASLETDETTGMAGRTMTKRLVDVLNESRGRELLSTRDIAARVNQKTAQLKAQTGDEAIQDVVVNAGVANSGDIVLNRLR